MLLLIKKLIPKRLFGILQPLYHYFLSVFGALIYLFPSRKIFVVAVTGTKGKSSTVELVNSILEEKGYKTAMAGTIHFKIGNKIKDNKFKMTMPGRFFMQKFLKDAVKAGCSHAVIEMTSEGVKQSRHRFIDIDTLIFTNLSPEHIEAHGSFENYVKAKLKLRNALEHSSKKEKAVVANIDDKYGKEFLDVKTAKKVPYSLKDIETYKLGDGGTDMTVDGVPINSKLLGKFNIYNMLAAISFAKSQHIDIQTIKRGIEKVKLIKGRVEKIEEGQSFTVVVDYAHTADSLEKLYETFKDKKTICVLGSTGGGRDKWKRPEMGKVADKFCSHIILTDEDPYDESPRRIIEEISTGIKKNVPEIIMERREAIGSALEKAGPGDVVLITGKGTDPYIMGPHGSRIPWSDASVTKEELLKILNKTKV